MSRHPSVLAVSAYRAANPGVDFSGQVFLLDRTEDGGYVVTGHAPRDERSAMLDRCCRFPDDPRGPALHAPGSTKP